MLCIKKEARANSIRPNPFFRKRKKHFCLSTKEICGLMIAFFPFFVKRLSPVFHSVFSFFDFLYASFQNSVSSSTRAFSAPSAGR